MIIADTGFWIALADKKDRHHQEADNFAKTTDERLISTYPVITEVCHILLKRQGIKAQLNFVKMYQLGAFEVFEIPKNDKDKSCCSCSNTPIYRWILPMRLWFYWLNS
jgi:predicted nucleic acid-binding protein